MIKDQVLHMKLLRQASGIQRRAVMLFVRMENFLIPVQTEGFAQQPVTAFGIGSGRFLIGFIPQTGKPCTILKPRPESELFCFRGMDAVSYTHLDVYKRQEQG